jgi:hypothetical protein
MAEPWSGAGVVETYTGVGFDLFDPDPADVRLADVAAGLAHTCRFGGHCRRFYSVARHSLLVSRELDGRRRQTLGLLHDAAEAYVGDVPRPLKAEVSSFDRVEAAVLDAVWRAFDVDPPTEGEWAAVMAADDRLLAYEAAELLEGGEWAGDPPDLDYDLSSDDFDAVRRRFRSRAERLLDRSRGRPANGHGRTG